MSVICKQKQFELIFPAIQTNIDKSCLKIKQFLVETGNKNFLFEVELLIREALVNAVVHGCQENEQKMVRLNLSLVQNELVMEVQDDGDGFDWKSRIGKEAALSDEHGRGIMIFNSYASDIKYNEKGNKITLRKSIV